MNYTPLGYAILASFLALALMYIDTKLFDNPKTKSNYVRGMLMVGVIVWIVVYFLEKGGFSSGESSSFMPGINEEILTGPPNF